MPMPIQRRLASVFLSLAVAAATSGAALAQKKYDTGASDTEIKIGNIVPYSGPASAYGVVGKAMGAVFKKVNDDGGINGRKINFISYDDAYSPPKAVEQARKLIESDEVLLLFGTSGHRLQHRDPEIRQQQEGAATVRRHRRHQMERPEELSLDHGLAAQLPERSPASTQSILTKEKPAAKIAVLYQNDDMGKDYLKGLKDGLGQRRLTHRRRGELRSG